MAATRGSSGTGLQTTRFREDARDIIRRAVRATADDCVIFCGSGATGAIDKLVDCLGISLPRELADRYALLDRIPPKERPVVFIGPFEHHSNELPWRESIADVVTIEEDADGHVSLEHLARELRRYGDRPLKIGSFSAASNVTGIATDTVAIAKLLHAHGALSFWDYAAAAPYVDVDMSPKDDSPDGHLAYKDAIFVSPHKFVGGPGTPGVLVAKRKLFRNRVPSVPGGGTVMNNVATIASKRFLRDEPNAGAPDELGVTGGAPSNPARGHERRSDTAAAGGDRWGSRPLRDRSGRASAHRGEAHRVVRRRRRGPGADDGWHRVGRPRRDAGSDDGRRGTSCAGARGGNARGRDGEHADGNVEPRRGRCARTYADCELAGQREGLAREPRRAVSGRPREGPEGSGALVSRRQGAA